MGQRSELKNASLHRILDASAARLRQEGVSGAAITAVMREAGLTHGAFYCHFASKEDLAIAALRHALKENRGRWVGSPRTESWRDRLVRLGRRYLTQAHRDDVANGCALAALAGDAARNGPAFKTAFQEEALKSLRAICAASDDDRTIDPERFDDAIAFLALCIGGISLARAVEDQAFSDRILDSCRQVVSSFAAALPPTNITAEPTDDFES